MLIYIPSINNFKFNVWTTIFPLAIKSQYYLQLVYPTVWDATVIGKFRGTWAEFKNTPNNDDNVMTWGWVIKDTCVGG